MKRRPLVQPTRTFLAVAAALLSGALVVSVTQLAGAEKIVFNDVKAQTLQFMLWERKIKLTPEQEALKKAALTALPAPCCSDNSAYTCCCTCNLSRTIWGLSNHLIAKQGAGVNQVQETVVRWIKFIKPRGWSGEGCYTGGCSRPFVDDGCGGMKAHAVVF